MSQANSQPTSQAGGAGRLTTHVLDTVRGGPAVGMRIALYREEAAGAAASSPREWVLLKDVVTNDDGRIDAPLLAEGDLRPGRYRLVFEVEAYFRAQGAALPQPAFLGQVPLEFGIADAGQHYHVPLLVSPWAYSTYRGS